ncbi:MAG: hypothetical protein WCX69_02230 [Candidatus Paceibacterota bacterium]
MSRNYLEAFVIILVTIALGYFLVWPKNVELKDIRAQIDQKNAEIENRENYYANLEIALFDINQYGEIVKKIDTAFPVDPDAPSFMNFLQAAAMQSGLVLGNADYSGSAKVEVSAPKKIVGQSSVQPDVPQSYSLQNYSVSVQLTGNYANFKDFLSRMEHSSRLAEVGTINVSSKKDESGKKGENEKEELPVSMTAQKQDPSEAVLNYNVKLIANHY